MERVHSTVLDLVLQHPPNLRAVFSTLYLIRAHPVYVAEDHVYDSTGEGKIGNQTECFKNVRSAQGQLLLSADAHLSPHQFCYFCWIEWRQWSCLKTAGDREQAEGVHGI